MKTAVIWLAEVVSKLGYVSTDILEQAEEMQKQQMKEAVLNNVTSHPRFRKIFEEQFEHWFDETYKSKESDEYTTVNWGGVIQKIPKKGSGELEQINQDNPVTRGSTALVKVTSCQTEISNEKPMRFHCVPKEISDEDIEKASEYMNDKGKWYWRDGAKWYREQIKGK